MKWLELSVETPREFVEPLSEIFYRYGHGGVAIELGGGYSPDEGESLPSGGRVTVKTYLPVNESTGERRSRIDLGVRLVAHVSSVSALSEREIEEEEWEEAWKEHFHPLRVGERLVVAPSWRDYAASASDIVVRLDPGMAFGTGHHPTTRMCLELIETALEPGMDVLDVGCGSGILSIAAARLGARSVVGLDLDQTAVRAAKRNILENGVSYAVRIMEGTLPHREVRKDGYDVTVANISARVVSETASELALATRRGGTIIASGLLTQNSRMTEEALEEARAHVQRSVVDGDWVTLVARMA